MRTEAQIVAIGSGACNIAVKLVLAKKQLWTKTPAAWRLPGAHQFETPIAIPYV
ncbi:MAG: hypothetical protein JWR77_566 [Rhizorhabdus sp.]|nr:hypothetical protein [Rhizorhabdus sp.]